jgi:hypothetical protein
MRSLRQKSMVLLVAVFALAGCASVQVSQDYDPRAVAYRHGTWQWEESIQPATGDLRVDNPLLNNRIRRAIETHLAGRDIHQSQQQPDLHLTYRLSIQPKIQSYSSYSTMGVGYYHYPWYGGIDADTCIYQYDECQLTIDIKAADTKTLLWRGTGIYRLRTYKTPDAAAEDMQRTVDRIIAQFPPVEMTKK